MIIDREKNYNLTVSGKFIDNLLAVITMCENPLIADGKPVDINVRLGFYLGQLVDEVYGWNDLKEVE